MERYKHTPSKRAAAKRSANLWTWLIVILCLALIAGILVFSPVGSFLLEHVVSPVYSCIAGPSEDKEIAAALQQQDEKIETKSPTPKPAEKTKEIISMAQTPYYILQMGAYMDEVAANTHAEEIRRLGAAGVVFQEGSVYRVFAAAYADENSLVKVQAQVRDDGFEATPYITETHVLKLTANGDEQAVTAIRDCIASMSDIPAKLCQLALAYDKNECTAENLLNEIQSMQKKCVDASLALSVIKDESVKPIRECLAKYEEKLSTFLKEHDTIHTETLSGDLKHLQISVIIDYILFFDRK